MREREMRQARTQSSCPRHMCSACKEKGAAERTAAPSSSSSGNPSVGLLDRREFPVAAASTREGPDFGGLDRRVAAGDQTAGAALQRLVDQREAHRDARIVGLAFAPGFREVALQQLDT